MKSFFPLFAIVVLAAASIPDANAVDRIGVRSITIPSPERGVELNVTVWYPAAAAGGTPILVGDNAVFNGTPAHRDAPMAGGSLPIILLSHGGLRAAPNQDGWIASRLAAEGFVVATPQQPDPGGLSAADAVQEIWLRPGDLSATLTALERDPVLAGKIAPQEVGVLGFLLGGSSALALAGARRDAGAYAESCDPGGTGVDCGWFAKSGVDLHKIDLAKMGRSDLDPRIKAVVSVDPEIAATFTATSLSGIAIPVHIINLGRQDTMLPGLRAAGVTGHIPEAQYDRMPDATRFDVFGECKPEGPAILRDEGDDESLCQDGALPRAEIHAQLAAMIATSFKRHLQDKE
jgi:predicted dienelactone hydrolase